MSYNSKKSRGFNSKKHSRKAEMNRSLTVDESLSVQKNRARDLRNSSWWRKKTAKGECYYCGSKFKPSELTMDHKIPVSRGGKSDRNNLVPACKHCNNRKKNMIPLEWNDYLENLKNRRELF